MTKPIRNTIKPLPAGKPMAATVYRCEADVAEGLEAIAHEELEQRFGSKVKVRHDSKPGLLRFSFLDDLHRLLEVKTIQAIYVVRHFEVPRPKALLGDEHFRALLGQIEAVRKIGTFTTFHLNAAGSDSSVMKRIKEEVAIKTGLEDAPDEGDLLIRVRRAETGWEVLVRISPRPLATRAWRVCNREGALNATVAHAMVLLTRPQSNDVFLNLMCGSGTLLIERLAAEVAYEAVGYDHDEMALNCARQNVEASGYGAYIKLNRGDVRSLPIEDRSVDAICADLPFGHLSGSHEGNVELYPEILREAGRVAKPDGRFVLITHEVRLIEGLLAESSEWTAEQVIRVALGGLYPRIFVLRRT
jgi:tRNA (guanine6-N2)-methyltransferase